MVLVFCDLALAQQPLPKVTIGVEKATKPEDVAVTLQILLLLTILSLAPALVIMMTSFTRIIVVFHFLRQALGTQQMPPNQLMIGLALFLTFFIMTPVWKDINDKALQPYLHEEISQKAAFQEAIKPLREFMLRQVRQKDLALFVKLAKMNKPQNISEVPTHVIIPAFIISELRIAFQIGFVLYLPLLMIDMVVASVLMAMGMMMLPPVMISLPFKLLLFVLVDGWYLIVESIITGFH
ncbi:MAG: flagellar type III secretion system pore protein FliP [candidate division KSB1 bacterium]|nr:flagellar type III secretion system pore protein FliP [candidate division KSB1 bacterium]